MPENRLHDLLKRPDNRVRAVLLLRILQIIIIFWIAAGILLFFLFYFINH